MREKFFHEVGKLICSNATYNSDYNSIEVEKNKIRSALEDITPAIVGKIIFAAERIAAEQSLRIEKESGSLTCNLPDVKMSLDSLANTIFRFGYLQSSIFSKENLFEKLSAAGIEDSDLVEKIKISVDKAFYSLKDGSIDEDIPSASSDLKICLENLKYYKDHIKLPEWLGEIIVRQDNNKVVAEKNMECIENLKGKVSITSEYSIDSLEKAFNYCFENASDLREALSKNNDLLSRIEIDMVAKKRAAEVVIDAFEKFQYSIADGVILKYLQSDNKILGYKLKSLAESLQSQEELNSVTIVEEQLKILKEFSLKNEIRDINLLEAAIGLKSSLGIKIRDINKDLVDLAKALNAHKQKLIDNSQSPILESIFIYERSVWQSCKKGFANFSKFFIGHDNHVNLYGGTDGVEELRRAIDEIKDHEISAIELEISLQ